MSVRVLPPPATIDDLLKVDGKAELIGGRIVRYMPIGHLPNIIATRILRRLADHVDMLGQGVAYMDQMGFAVPKLPSGRQSFSPDVSFYNGPLPLNPMRFVGGPSTFAVEVHSENDYGPAKEVEIEERRVDYFAAGMQVVWDVDPIANTIDCYRASAPTQPVRFAKGDTADAEPAVPGWRLPVDWLFA